MTNLETWQAEATRINADMAECQATIHLANEAITAATKQRAAAQTKMLRLQEQRTEHARKRPEDYQVGKGRQPSEVIGDYPSYFQGGRL